MVNAPVLVSYSSGIQVITINRPEVRNAINLETAKLIASALDDLDARHDIRASIITGSGTTFCAGMDLKAFLDGERPSVPGRGFAGIVERPPIKPIIAAVEGHAIGGGFEIVLACDLVVASETAIFGLPEVKRGLLPGGGGLLRLPSRIPRFIAMEWILTGEYISAKEAQTLSLLNRLVPNGAALASATELALLISANAPLAVQAAKQIVVESSDWPSDEAFARQQIIYEPVRSSADATEGASAFKERRAPIWRGR